MQAAETGVESKAQNLISSGAFLAEVDAGLFTIGDRLTCDAFIARVYSLADAQSRFPASSRGGGVIVEMPQGVFSLYSTSAVSQSNRSQTSLDAADSQNGVLVRNRQDFLHALVVRLAFGCNLVVEEFSIASRGYSYATFRSKKIASPFKEPGDATAYYREGQSEYSIIEARV